MRTSRLAKRLMRRSPTISAVSTTAWKSTLAPFSAHSGVISSASLWERPSSQGHITMVVGATFAAQQASWPAPETMSRWQ